MHSQHQFSKEFILFYLFAIFILHLRDLGVAISKGHDQDQISFLNFAKLIPLKKELTAGCVKFQNMTILLSNF